MPSFKTTRDVAHSADDMFQLVADVERYPQFVPLCQSLRVLRREEDSGNEVIIAQMGVAYKLFSESFTSRVVLNRQANEIVVTYLDGPFRRLQNVWSFTPLGNAACKVGFYLDYEFQSKALAMLMGAAFDRAFRKFADAFEERADQIYGKNLSRRTVSPQIGGAQEQT